MYASPNIIRVIRSRNMRLARHVARMGAMRKTYKIVFAKPEGNIRMDLRRIAWGIMC
jgi:hypothetical protein